MANEPFGQPSPTRTPEPQRPVAPAGFGADDNFSTFGPVVPPPALTPAPTTAPTTTTAPTVPETAAEGAEPAAPATAEAPHEPTAEGELPLQEVLQETREIRCIGRRLRVRMKGNYYQGLVIHVSKLTVALMNVVMMAEADAVAAADAIAQRKKEERDARRARRAAQSAEGEAAAEATEGEADGPEPPAAQASTSEERADAVNAKATLLPYVTFNRHVLEEVVAVDEGHAVKPTRKRPHEQKLRAFIRSYVILRTMGSLSAGMTPHDYVLLKTGWTGDEAEMAALVEEETGTVDEWARDIKKGKEAARPRQTAAQRQAAAAAAADDDSDVGFFDDDPQSRLFRTTGIPQRTLVVALLHVVCGIVVLLYTATVFSTANSAVVQPFANGSATWIAIAAVAELLCSAGTALSSLRMRLPTPRKIIVLRVTMWLIGVGFLAPALIASGSSGIGLENVLTGRTPEAVYRDQVSTGATALCSYARANRCGGYDTVCTTAAYDTRMCPAGCTATQLAGEEPCGPIMEATARRVLLPIFAVLFVCAAVFVADAVLFARFVLFGRTVGAFDYEAEG